MRHGRCSRTKEDGIWRRMGAWGSGTAIPMRHCSGLERGETVMHHGRCSLTEETRCMTTLNYNSYEAPSCNSEFKYFVIWPKICQVLGKMFQFSGKRVCIWDFFVFLPKAWNFLWKISAKTLPFPYHFCLKFLWQNPLIFPTSSAYKCPVQGWPETPPLLSASVLSSREITI